MNYRDIRSKSAISKKEENNKNTINHNKRTIDKEQVNERKITLSPDKQSRYSNIQNDDIKNKLKRIFEHYCQYGERMNFSSLKSHNYYKFAIDANLIDLNLTKTRIELIFTTETKTNKKKNLDFNSFLHTIVKIADYKYVINNPKKNYSDNSLQRLMKEHIFVLYDKLFEQDEKFELKDDYDISNNVMTEGCKRGSIVSVLNVDELIINTQLENILKSVAAIMFEIYKVYFPWELSLSQDENFLKENSIKAFVSFTSEFELCPDLISKGSGYSIFQSEILKNDDIDIYFNILKEVEVSSLGKNNKFPYGKFFNFIKFLKCLCTIASYGYENLNISNNLKFSVIEKICLTFERMELSKGFHSLQQKTSKTNSGKTSFIIPLSIIEKIKEDIAYRMNDSKEEKKTNMFTIFKDTFEYSDYILENYKSDLFEIFQYYCSFGDQLNNTNMKSNKFAKLIKEAGLIKIKDNSKGIKMNDVDIIFFKLNVVNTGSKVRKNSVNSNAKIDFNQFISAIEMIAIYIYPESHPKDAIDMLLRKNILPLLKLGNKNSIIKNEGYEEIIKFFSKSISPLYKCYMNKNSMIGFNELMKFTTDFGIFPDLISKAKIILYYKNETNSADIEKSLIDFYSFINVLIQCINDLPYLQCDKLEKVILFVERMQHSKGISKLIRDNKNTKLVSDGDTLDLISIFKQNYPEYFNMLNDANKQKKKPDFFELLNN